MAGLRNHPAPHRSRIRRPGPVSARLRALPLRRTRRRYLRPAQAPDVLLRRLRPLLRPSASHQLASPALRALDLRRLGAPRNFPQLQLSREPRLAPAVGSRRALLKRCRLECQHLSNRKHRRPRHRRTSLCALSRSRRRLCDSRNRVHRLHPPHPAHPSADHIAGKSGRRKNPHQPPHRPGRSPFYLGKEADLRFDLARHVRRPTRRRDAPCFPSTPEKFCTPVPGDSAFCAAPPE